MIYKDIIATIVLGLVGGLTPGPILLIALSEILRSPQKGITNGGMYIIVAGLTELLVGLFLVVSYTWFKIPVIFLHIISFVGVAVLVYIGVELYKIKKIDYEKEQKKVSIKHIIALMFFNGPMWLFWISVCLPMAFSLGSQIKHGEYLFVLLFEVSMILTMTLIFFGFNSLRRFLHDQKIIRRIFIILSVLIFLIALKIFYGELNFFF